MCPCALSRAKIPSRPAASASLSTAASRKPISPGQASPGIRSSTIRAVSSSSSTSPSSRRSRPSKKASTSSLTPSSASISPTVCACATPTKAANSPARLSTSTSSSPPTAEASSKNATDRFKRIKVCGCPKSDTRTFIYISIFQLINRLARHLSLLMAKHRTKWTEKYRNHS